jgi:SAM-dependent methyltransferase
MLEPLLGHLAQKAYWTYFFRSAAALPRRSRCRCPSCGEATYQLVARKMLVTALVRCMSCELLYRIPNDPPRLSHRLYQEQYTADVYSDVPSPEALREMIAAKFLGTVRDHTQYIQVLQSLGADRGARVFEWGPSWGYGTWQLREAGYEVVGFELGEARARYARRMLDVRVEDDLSKIDGRFDVFFSAHVWEHLTSPLEALQMAARFLKPGGLFVAFVPNGSQERLRDGKGCRADWGMYHPILLDDRYCKRAFGDTAILLASSPYQVEQIRTWDHRNTRHLNLLGPELVVVAPLHSR